MPPALRIVNITLMGDVLVPYLVHTDPHFQPRGNPKTATSNAPYESHGTPGHHFYGAESGVSTKLGLALE